MGRTIVHGNFEWDSDKNYKNIKKHGISFMEIIPMFDDPLFWERSDNTHSTIAEERFLGIAKLDNFTVVVSCYTEKERTRILSARVSTSEEEQNYEEWCKQFYN